MKAQVEAVRQKRKGLGGAPSLYFAWCLCGFRGGQLSSAKAEKVAREHTECLT